MKPDTYYRPVSRHIDSEQKVAVCNAILEAQSELRNTLRKLLGVYQDLQAAQRFLGA